jgi:hypothetical protein
MHMTTGAVVSLRFVSAGVARAGLPDWQRAASIDLTHGGQQDDGRQHHDSDTGKFNSSRALSAAT